MSRAKTLNTLATTADDITTALAVYDLEIRELDLPGVPDSVWEKLTALSYNLEQMAEEELYRYDPLDFENDDYEDEEEESDEDGEETN